MSEDSRQSLIDKAEQIFYKEYPKAKNATYTIEETDDYLTLDFNFNIDEKPKNYRHTEYKNY